MNADQLIRQLRARDQHGFGRVDEADYGVPNIERLTALDARATMIRSFNVRVVPGPLQTPEYSAHVMSSAYPKLRAMEVSRRMLLKNARAAALYERLREGSLRAHFIIGEAAITRSTWDFETHVDQLDRILTYSRMQGVTVKVYPDTKLPPELASHFLIYQLPGHLAEEGMQRARVGYTETIMGACYCTRLDALSRMHDAFAALNEDAMGTAESRRFIGEVVETWRTAQQLADTMARHPRVTGSSRPTQPTTASPFVRRPKGSR